MSTVTSWLWGTWTWTKSQQQNLMKNLIKTRNLNKIETGVGLSRCQSAPGWCRAQRSLEKVIQRGHWGSKFCRTVSHSHKLYYSLKYCDTQLVVTVSDLMWKLRNWIFLALPRMEKDEKWTFSCYGGGLWRDCVSNIILISKEKHSINYESRRKSRTQWD